MSISDEGFRAKYALTRQDEMVRPGIDILVLKYFLRNDGKSVELTHDVLTPLIKTDREKRRKDIAFAAARKKARKRALIIIISALLISAAVAWGIWYYITGEAKQAKKEAIQDRKNALDSTQKLIGQLTHDSIKLKSIQDSIRNLRKGKDTDPKSDTSLLSPAKEYIYDRTLMELQKQYTDVKKQYDDLKIAKAALDNINSKLDARVNSLSGDQSKTESETNELKKNIRALSKLKHDDSIEFKKDMQKIRGDYDLLKRNFDEYKLQYPATYPKIPVTITTDNRTKRPMELPDTNSLQLNLHYGTSKNMPLPGNLKIYLIPDSSYNKKIIREAMLYEIRCNENIGNATNIQTAIFRNKKYSFPNVSPGRYFIKICSYYGGYYFVTKKGIGNETTSKLDLSPPIR